ncbi:substrate-binding domain-containing protein [bacterium]|nr:substrate-binding domain-containing protein [bacterium]
MTRFLSVGLMLVFLCSCKGGKGPRKRVYVFSAACLNTALAEFEKSFEQKYRDVDVRVEVSGSLVAARKVSEYKRRGDIVISADKRVIDSLLIPNFADWQVAFLSNEMVLAYSENSRRAAEVNSSNWPKILLEPEVSVARADENLGPLGYQTLLVWKLADMHYRELLQGASLFETLSKKVSRELIRPDAAELLPTLGTEVDYIFIYRSMAKDHILKHILLPPEVNLSSLPQKDFYSRVSVAISAAPGESLTIRGEPILFSLTILREAPNKDGAISFVKTLLGREGRSILQRHGFSPLSPPRLQGPRESFPESLRVIIPEPGDSSEVAR